MPSALVALELSSLRSAGSAVVMRGWWIRQSSTAIGRQLRARLKPSAGGVDCSPGDDVELAANAIPPGVVDRMHVRCGMLDVLPVKRVEHDVALQLDLVRIRNVLELTAAAPRHVGTRWCDPVRRRFDNPHDLGKGRRPLPIPDRDLHILARDAAFDQHRRALLVVGKAQIHHGPCVRDAPGLLLREPFAKQTVHQRHVGLAAGCILDRAHQLAEGLLLAGAEVRGRGRVGGDGSIDETH